MRPAGLQLWRRPVKSRLSDSSAADRSRFARKPLVAGKPSLITERPTRKFKMDSMIRYGILGFGNHAVRRMVPAFAGAKLSTLAGIWRRDTGKAEANARAFGIDRVFLSAEELCASPAIDAVFVCSPDALHLRDTLLALSCGKPVLCEKPAAMNVAEVEQMLAASSQAGVMFGVAQNFRYNDSVSLIRDWVRQGRAGSPIFATAHFCFQAERSPRRWIYDPSLACGGAIGDVGIHCIDSLRYILSDEITAVTTMARGEQRSGGLETDAALAMEFSGGALGSIMVSYRARYRTWVEVVGDDGTIQCDDGLTVDHPVQVVLQQKGKIVESQQLSNKDAYSNMLDAFSAAVEGRGVYAAPGTDAVHNQAVLDAAYASLRSGCRQTIGLRAE